MERARKSNYSDAERQLAPLVGPGSGPVEATASRGRRLARFLISTQMNRLVSLFLASLMAVPTLAQGTIHSGPAGPETVGVRDRVLAFEAQPIDTGFARVGDSASIELPITNVSDSEIEITGIELVGAAAAEFAVAFERSLPFSLDPDEAVAAVIVFGPSEPGGKDAQLVVDFEGSKTGSARAALRGLGLGPAGADLFMNAGGDSYVGESLTWTANWGARYGQHATTSAPVSETLDDSLYQSYHTGSFFGYSFALPDGWYELDLHFNEPLFDFPGRRVFDVEAEGEPIVEALDLAVAAGMNIAHVETRKVRVQDGALDLSFVPATGEPLVVAIAIRAIPQLEITPGDLTFDTLTEGDSQTLDLTLTNAGAAPMTIDLVSIQPSAPGKTDAFSIALDGVSFAGPVDTDASFPVSVDLAPNDSLVVPVTFQPLLHDVYSGVVTFSGNYGLRSVFLYGVGASPGHPFLHVVIETDTQTIDYDGDGFAPVTFDGTLSHTHELGHVLTDFIWTQGGNTIGTSPVVTPSLPVGAHEVTLEILDDNVPQERLSGSVQVEVFPITDVPGVLVRYYDGASTSPSVLIDSVPVASDYAAVSEGYRVENAVGTVGGSPYSGPVLVQMTGSVELAVAGTYEFVAEGGTESRVEVGGVSVSGPVALGAGQHNVEARFALGGIADLPVQLRLASGGGAPMPIEFDQVAHSLAGLVPVINEMPSEGTTAGGNLIEILGLGFFVEDEVTIHFGTVDLTLDDTIVLDADRIVFNSPPGPAGTVAVTVETPAGISNAREFSYQTNGPVPIDFEQVASIFVSDPTCGTWGPDGRYYVGRLNGKVNAFEFNDDWTVASESFYDGLITVPNPTITGIAFDPRDVGNPGQLYLSHGLLFFPTGGAIPPGTVVPYYGQVSVVDGPGFAYDPATSPLITGLPGTNHDHAVNGLEFDHDGDLYVTVGSATNAGIIGVNSGDLPESPFSTAILKARITRPDFNGAITYLNSAGFADSHANDQMYGWDHIVAPGTHVEVFASGTRNPYDLTLHTNGHLYATDNGPNLSFGVASLSATLQSSEHPQTDDELLLVEQGHYYGSPNRNRGRFDNRQNAFRANGEPRLGRDHTPGLATLASSTNGISEYRSESFGGQLRGDLIVQRFGSFARRVELDASGRTVTADANVGPFSGALDVDAGPGGALVLISYSGDRIKIFVPVDPTLTELEVLDIQPWRGPAEGGMPFVIGGNAFGSLSDTSVEIGGVAATLTDVRPTRIEGVTPSLTPGAELLDVSVTVAGQTVVLSEAYRPLGPRGSEPGRWEDAPDLPNAIGEVVAAELGDRLYVMGEGNGSTFVLDILSGVWSANAAPRPFVGHHHSCEVVDGKIYLIGGLGGGSNGKIQIYDPVTDQWTVGPNDMPWSGGSVQTALIDGEIYVAGGIIGNTTIDNHAKYNPLTHEWTTLAPHPTQLGRNHAAAATDGERFWIFGGRGVGSGACNCVANGFAQVQVYDPKTNTWETSDDPGTSLVPMPVGRGGTGKAIWFQNEFYVFGGETENEPSAVSGDVYDRVDVYNPVDNTWRLDAPMPVPRHGIYPVLYLGRIYLAGGGTTAAFSQSAAVDIFNHQ